MSTTFNSQFRQAFLAGHDSRGSWILLWVVWIIWCGPMSGAELSSGWRVYKASDKLADTFASAVTISPRTNVWVRHGAENDRISRLDGYSVRTLSAPTEGTHPIYESRSGQLWSVYPEGLMLYQGEKWAEHPVAEIRSLVESEPLRRIRSIPLAPAEVDHVLFLLPDRLLEYSAESRQVTTLIRVAGTGLGRFNDMAESSDGHLWITGARGVGRVEGPLRQIRSGVRWRDWVSSDSYQNFQRPFDDEEGGVTTVAETTGRSERVVAHFRNGQFEFIPGPSSKIRNAWRNPQGGFWALSRDALWRSRADGGEWIAIERGDGLATTYNEVAVGSGGMFWLATPDGLLRFAPPLWSLPSDPSVSGLQSQLLLSDGNGALWFASSEQVSRYDGATWKTSVWIAKSETQGNDLRAAWLERGASMLLSQSGGIWKFDSVSGEFSKWEPGGISETGSEFRVLGNFRSGRVLLERIQRRPDGHEIVLFSTDGRKVDRWLAIEPSWGMGDEVSAFLETETSDVWLGGVGAAALWRDGKIQIFSRRQGYLPFRTAAMIEAGPGRIWCGGGDSVQEFDGKIWSLVRSGFERVQSIKKARDGSILVAATSGFHRFHDGSWVLNTFEEGLPSPTVLDADEDPRGRLWVATSRGLALYNPSSDLDAPRSTIVPLRGSKGPGGQGSLTFQIRGVDRWKSTIPERLLYSKRLDGGPWGPYQPESILSFTDLAAGSHRLEARAMDRGWNIEKGSSTIEFNVVIPWHQDPRLLSFSVAGLLVTFFFAALAVNRHLRLVRSYAEVERIVAERTAQLERANQELLHSQKMRALGTLAAGVAHDFNNILSVVKGSAQVIEDNLEDRSRILARTERIRTVVDQGATLVRSMLGMGRGATETPAACRVAELLEESVKTLGEAFVSNLTVEVKLMPGLPQIHVIRNLLVQVIHNLLANGVDSMGGRGVMQIDCRMCSEFPSMMVIAPVQLDRLVQISISDSGAGISPDALPRIFEPFFTTKAFSKRRGTGLGLSMVYEMVKGMGIGLSVESKLGHGTTFTLYVPAVLTTEPPGGLNPGSKAVG